MPRHDKKQKALERKKKRNQHKKAQIGGKSKKAMAKIPKYIWKIIEEEGKR